MCKKIVKYFSKHPNFNSIVSLFIGIGVGILICRPIIGSHPLRFGLFFLVLGLLGYLYSFLKK
jgi:hypothetical protein